MTLPFEYKPERLYPEIPLYFKRSLGGAGDQPGPLPEFVFDMRTSFPDEPLIIYGYAVISSFPEDRHLERQAWVRRRAFLSNCFSLMCPEGELGFTEADVVEEITQEDFENARDRNWS